ncbi:hypothetical protein [Cohnella sp. LGH]|uniref:hypothetical protein n=1 Tax=Cohnella sp. LGH TaxID=1619153 RepID=UPI00353041D5
MINWKQKLASRKFWALVGGLATSALVLIGAGEDTIVKVAGLITAAGTVVAYIFGEAHVDASRPPDDDPFKIGGSN